jgi:sugar phosphate isomerase/epimerase
MDKMADLCKEAGLLCCHENEKDIYGDTIARTLDILKNFEGRIVGVFDPANFIQCHQDTLEAWQTLAPYIDYIHIKDCKEDGTIMPAGKGIGHIPEIIRAYSQKEGERIITLEPHLMEFSGLQGLEKDDVSQMQHEYSFKNNRESFDFAAVTLKEIIQSVLCE